MDISQHLDSQSFAHENGYNLEKLREIGSKIKLIVCDLDGTLLDSRHRPDKRTLEVLARAQREGIAVTFSTGRGYDAHLLPLINQAGITTPVITCNGAEVTDPVSGRELFHNVIPEKDAVELIQYIWQTGIRCVEAAADPDCFSGVTNSNLRYPYKVDPTDQRYSAGIRALKINFGPMTDEQFGKMNAYINANENLTCTSGSGFIYEVMHRGSSKGAALRVICNHLGITTDEVCAFGDSLNDISSLETAGLSVAMGNAFDIVKEKAMYVTDTNDNNGIGKAIDSLILRHKRAAHAADLAH